LFVEGYPDHPEGKTVDPDRAREYTLPLTHRRARVPKFAELQTLENDVAYLLKRPAHELVVEDLESIHTEFDLFLTIPKAGISWRRQNDRSPDSLAIAYAWGWPTHGEVVEVALTELFTWQYGYLWTESSPARAKFNFPEGLPIETLLEHRVRRLTQTYYRLAGYLHAMCPGRTHINVAPDELLEGIQISEQELQLFLIAWGPRGLYRWRSLTATTIARASAQLRPDSSCERPPAQQSFASQTTRSLAGILPEMA
jgi:hypothetical protein